MEPTSRPMSIEGPYANERNRVEGMTDEDRAWRKKWLKDQELSHHEPRQTAESKRMNPIRRAYRLPLDWVFSKLEPQLVSGNVLACSCRQLCKYDSLYETLPTSE